MSSAIRKVMSAGFLLVLIVILANAVWATRNVVVLHRAASSTDHSRAIISQLTLALSTLTDAETGQRGYLLTGAKSYLAPFRSAESQLPGVLDRLDSLLESPVQKQRLERLRDVAMAGDVRASVYH